MAEPVGKPREDRLPILGSLQFLPQSVLFHNFIQTSGCMHANFNANMHWFFGLSVARA